MQANIIPIYSCSTRKLSMINNVSGALEALYDEFNSPIDYVDDSKSIRWMLTTPQRAALTGKHVLQRNRNRRNRQENTDERHKGWPGRDQRWESLSFCDSRGRVGHTDASFVQLSHAWGMGSVVCCGKTSPWKQRKDVRPRESKQRKLLMEPLHSESVAGHEGALVWWWRATGTVFPLGEGGGGCWGRPLREPAGLLRCHLHIVWQTPPVWPLFTPPPIPFLPRSWTVEWRPQPGRDHRQGRRLWVLRSRLLAPSLHTYVAPFCLLPLFSFPGFGVPLLILCLQDFYQGLTQTYATCQPASHGHAAWSQTRSRLRLEKHCRTWPATRRAPSYPV